MTRKSVPLLAAAVLLACGGSAKPAGYVAPDPAAALTKAEEATQALMTTLQARLQGALRDGATVDALGVCADVAQEITTRVREEQGISVRRTALKVRNPANAPDGYERAWLEANADRASFPPGGVHEVVTRPDGARELRYLRPILLQALCVRCHGSPGQIDDDTTAALARLYPEDAATGYVPGQLRGVVSVRVPLAGD